MAKFKWRILLFVRQRLRDTIYISAVKMTKSRVSTGFFTPSTIAHITGLLAALGWVSAIHWVGWDILHLRSLSCIEMNYFCRTEALIKESKESWSNCNLLVRHTVFTAVAVCVCRELSQSPSQPASRFDTVLVMSHLLHISDCLSVYHPISRRTTVTLKECLCMCIILTLHEQWKVAPREWKFWQAQINWRIKHDIEFRNDHSMP